MTETTMSDWLTETLAAPFAEPQPIAAHVLRAHEDQVERHRRTIKPAAPLRGTVRASLSFPGFEFVPEGDCSLLEQIALLPEGARVELKISI